MEIIRVRYQGVMESLKTLEYGLARLEKESQSDLQTHDNEIYPLYAISKVMSDDNPLLKVSKH